MTEAQGLAAKRAGPTVFKAVPLQTIPVIWTPHGAFPLGTRRQHEVAR